MTWCCTTRTWRRFAHLALAAMLLLALFPFAATPATYAADYTVSDFAQLESAINDANNSAADDTITLDSDITLTGTLPTIIGNGSLTIQGNGHTLDGNNTYRIFAIRDGDVTLDNLTLQNGYSDSEGGAIYIWGDTLTVHNCTFHGNTTQSTGGGIYSVAILTVTDSTFSGNRAKAAGAIFVASEMMVSDSTFSNNYAAVAGGAISSAIIGKVTRSSFKGNVSDDRGGAINTHSSFTISDSTFDSNTAQGAGGSIYSNEELIVNTSTFSNNRAGQDGGSIFNADGGVEVTNSTFTNNTAQANGGAIYTEGQAYNRLYFRSNTFSNNHANANGGGIWSASIVEVSSNTLSGNSAGTSGGGIFNDSDGRLLLINTIITGSTGDSDCVNQGTLATNVNNLIEDGSCDAAYSGDPLLVDPDGADDTLGTNDDDLRLQAGSPAIDAGNTNYVQESVIGSDLNGDGDRDDTITTDLDGNARVVGNRVDIGAYEYQGNDRLNDGYCSLREAIVNANDDAQTYPDCPAGDGVDTITLDEPTYTLTDTFAYADGPNGLPSITSEIIIEGNGAVIERDSAAEERFRLFHISSAGNLTLNNTTVRGGHTPDGSKLPTRTWKTPNRQSV